MSARTNADIIRIVEKWQGAGLLHELTCRVDNRHQALVPIEREGKVILLCPTCQAVREDIPAVVLGSEAVIDFHLRMVAASLEDERIRRAMADVWWTSLVIMTTCVVFGGLFLGWPGAILGTGVGACIAGPYGSKKRKKIIAELEAYLDRP